MSLFASLAPVPFASVLAALAPMFETNADGDSGVRTLAAAATCLVVMGIAIGIGVAMGKKA